MSLEEAASRVSTAYGAAAGKWTSYSPTVIYVPAVEVAPTPESLAREVADAARAEGYAREAMQAVHDGVPERAHAYISHACACERVYYIDEPTWGPVRQAIERWAKAKGELWEKELTRSVGLLDHWMQTPGLGLPPTSAHEGLSANANLAGMRSAVVKVGFGRGFVVEAVHPHWTRVVVTAARCLPDRPMSFGLMNDADSPYPGLLGALHEPLPTVAASCVFMDTVADIAVLVGPKSPKVMFNQVDAYDVLIKPLPTLLMRTETESLTSVKVLALDGQWIDAQITSRALGGLVLDLPERIRGGMVGSPIVDADGRVVGVVSSNDDDSVAIHPGLQPCLARDLPVWLVEALSAAAHEDDGIVR